VILSAGDLADLATMAERPDDYWAARAALAWT
jgi:hypothetical protein